MGGKIEFNEPFFTNSVKNKIILKAHLATPCSMLGSCVTGDQTQAMQIYPNLFSYITLAPVTVSCLFLTVV